MVAGLLAAASLCAGCTEDPAKAVDRCIEESIAQGRQSNWIQGVWRITGDGKRDNCTDESLNADSMDISSRALRIHQQGHFVFVEDGAATPGFAMSGMVGDRCIHVRSSEQTSYGVVHYDLPAFFVTASSFDGEFTGSGPGECDAKGHFAVYAKLDPIPSSPIVNPAPPDAGISTESLCGACIDGCQLVDTQYVAACEEGCEQYVCHPASVADAGDAEAEADADADVTDATESPDAGDADLDAGDATAEDATTDDADTDAGDAAADDATTDDADTDAGDAAADDATTDDADTDAGDAAADDATTDDADTDAGDAAADDATTDDADTDANDGAAADADGVQYVLWDGSFGIDTDGSGGAGNGCSLSRAAAGKRSWGAGAIACALALGLSLRRRHRRRAGSPVDPKSPWASRKTTAS